MNRVMLFRASGVLLIALGAGTVSADRTRADEPATVVVVPQAESFAEVPQPSAPRRRIARFFRPKTFYLSNYAGTVYPPIGSPGVVEPTSGRYIQPHPFAHWFHRNPNGQ